MNFFKSLNLKAVLMVLFFSAFALAQGQISYTCNLRNDYQEDANNYVFDVYMLSTGTTAIEYNNMQLGFTFNSAIKNGGTVSVTLVPGYSDLPAAQQWLAANVSMVTAGIKVTVRTPTVGAGNGYIISNAGNGTRLGRFRLTNTVAFGQASPNLTWSFTTSPWPTKVFAYLPASTNITGSGAWGPGGTFVTSGLTNPVLNKPVTAFNVTGTGSYCQGGTGLAVGIDGSELGVTYTMNPGAVVMAGTGSAIDFGTYTAGTYTVSGARNATYLTGGMTGSAIITENTPVTATFTALGPYCVGAIPALLPTSSNNGYTGTWNPAAINTAAAGTTTYTFTPDGGQCALGTTMDVTVTANVTPTFAQLGPYLQGGVADPLPGTSIEGVTGTWDPATISTAAVGTITYTFTPAGGQCATTATMDVTINSAGPVNYTWNGSNNLWTMPTNWTPNGVPGALDNVTIPAGFGMNYPDITAATTIASLNIATGGALKGNANLTVTGATTVNVDLTGATNFHYISSPTANPSAISALDPATFLRKFDEATGNWVNLTGTDVMAPGKGYSAYGVAQTANFSGTLNAGFVTPAMTNTGNIGGANYEGWNLIGNPYCSPVDLSSPTLVSSDVMPVAYFWNGATNQYAYHNWMTHVNLNATQYVPVGQAFFVKASGAAPVVSFSEMCRTFNTQNFFKYSVDNIIRLHLEGEQMTNDAVVMFDENATTAIDNNYDAFALKASEINFIYTKSIENYDLAINALTSPEVNAVVPVYMDVVKSGNYTITASDLETFTYSLPIWLTDLKTGYSQNLLVNPVYSFSAQANENAGRFKLSFGSVGINDPAASNIGIYAERKNVHVTTPDNFRGTVQVYDILGKLVAERQLSGAGENIISLNVAGATYLVKVTNAQSSITRKVVLN